jgi:hypothetical protein
LRRPQLDQRRASLTAAPRLKRRALSNHRARAALEARDLTHRLFRRIAPEVSEGRAEVDSSTGSKDNTAAGPFVTPTRVVRKTLRA